MAFLSAVPMWTWVVVAVAYVSLIGFAVWRVRNDRARRALALEEERGLMENRLTLIEDAPPLSHPPSMYTRPEERWTKHPLPSKRPQGE